MDVHGLGVGDTPSGSTGAMGRQSLMALLIFRNIFAKKGGYSGDILENGILRVSKRFD